jgi:hypothetical protein
MNSYFRTEESLKAIDGLITCEKPNNAIYKFEGNIILNNAEKISLGADNLLLRGSSIRNTEFVYGVCVF